MKGKYLDMQKMERKGLEDRWRADNMEGRKENLHMNCNTYKFLSFIVSNSTDSHVLCVCMTPVLKCEQM